MITTALEKYPEGPLHSLVSAETKSRLAAGEKRFQLNINGRLVASKDSDNERQGFTLKIEPHLRYVSGASGDGRLRQNGVLTTLTWQKDAQNASLEFDGQSVTDDVEKVGGGRWYAKWGMKMSPNLSFQLGLGRTLSGGLVKPATVGEAGATYSAPSSNASVKVFQRPNEESLLALSGTLDSATGVIWGRVLERGVQFTGYHKAGNLENFGSLVFSRMLNGQAVAENRKVQLYARSMWYMESVPGLALGADVAFSRFDRNLSAFEPGHGGYFSPSRSATIGVVGKYTTRLANVDLLFLGGVGRSVDRVDAAAGDPITGADPGKYAAGGGQWLLLSWARPRSQASGRQLESWLRSGYSKRRKFL